MGNFNMNVSIANKKVLVTGADGFIGSHLVEGLLDKGCQVRAFVYYNSFNSWGWLDSFPKDKLSRIDVFAGDIRDPNGVRQCMQGMDIVFHLAALIAIPFSYHSPDSYVDTNIKGTLDDFNRLFEEVISLRFQHSLDVTKFEGTITKQDTSRLLGLAVLGNMRAFIYTCNQLITSLGNSNVVSYTHISEAFKQLSQNYFWPLLEEIEPKLGMYQPMVSPAEEISQILFEKAGEKCERSVLILREIVQRLSKPIEILEYVGFIARKEVSRVMKSRGRGTRFVLNLCNITEYLEHGRLSPTIVSKWLSLAENSVEFHKGSEFYKLPLPAPLEGHDLSILKEKISSLMKSNVYPYGLTDNKIQILLDNGIDTIEDLAMKTDDEILALPQVGVETLKRFRSTVNQAIWM
jgi:hypothetical protein